MYTLIQGTKTDFYGKPMRRAVISMQDALYFGIRKNPTPRSERPYPTWKSKAEMNA